MPLGAITQFAFGGALTAANLNAPVNSLKTLVDAFYDSVPTTYFTSANMTVAGTANKGVLRDGSGSGFFTGSVTASGGFIGNISGNTSISGNASVTGTFNTGGNVAVGSVPSPATLLVTGGSTFTGAITANGGVIGNASTATGLLAPVAFNALSSEYRPATNAAADTITIGAGPFYPDSAGNIVAGAAAQNVSLLNAVSAAQPTGTNSQYVLISFGPGTTTPTVTGGTVSGGAPAAPASPSSANWPIALVLRRGVTTNPSGVIAAADIIDLRGKGWGGGGTGGTGGTDSAVRAAAVWIQGTNVTFANEHDSTNASGTETGWFNPNLVKSGASDASLLAMARDVRPLLSSARLYRSAANLLTLDLSAAGTSPGPLVFAVSGRWAELTSDLTMASPASGTTGPRWLVIDLTTVGAPALRNVAVNTALTTYQAVIGSFIWDATAGQIRDEKISFAPTLNIDATQMAKYQVRGEQTQMDVNVLASTVNGAPQSVFTGTPVTSPSLILPAAMRVLIRQCVDYSIQSTITAIDFWVMDIQYRVNNGGWNLLPTTTASQDVRIKIPSGAIGTSGKIEMTGEVILPAGVYDFRQALSYSSTSTPTPGTGAVNLLYRYIAAEVYAG